MIIDKIRFYCLIRWLTASFWYYTVHARFKFVDNSRTEMF